MVLNSTTTSQPRTASDAIDQNSVIWFEVALNGAFGKPLVEDPIAFDAALAVYPADAPSIEEPDWAAGGTPLGI